MDFDEWFNKLLNVNAQQGQFGEPYPMGTCAYRDVIRDETVKKALKIAWEKYVNDHKN